MTTISKDTFRFLTDLNKSNNKEWFRDNKKRYEAAKLEFESFIAELIPAIATFDSSISGLDAKKTIFRIYRDVRFSKDKTPYHTYIGAHLVEGGRKMEHARSGYYIRLEPGNSFLAGGAYLPPGPWISGIRAEIADHADEFRKILNGSAFKNYFGELEGESLKTAPKGFPKDHPEIELLKRKSFLAVHKLKDNEVLNGDFIKHAGDVFKVLHPFGNFLNEAAK